ATGCCTWSTRPSQPLRSTGSGTSGTTRERSSRTIRPRCARGPRRTRRGALREDHRAGGRPGAETYPRGGRFDQAAMLELLDDVLVGHDSPRIRMWCDMGWAADRADVAEHLIEFEARANFIHAHHEHVVICSYQTTRFDGSFIIDILR